MRDRGADETRKLEAAGWEQRGEGPRAILRNPKDGRWYAHYQALDKLRKERFPTPGGGAP